MFNDNYFSIFLDKLSYKLTDCQELIKVQLEKLETHMADSLPNMANDCNCKLDNNGRPDLTDPNCQVAQMEMPIDMCKPNASPECASAVHNYVDVFRNHYKNIAKCADEEISSNIKEHLNLLNGWCKKIVRGTKITLYYLAVENLV